MGQCKYCGKDAGWFSSSHKECENKYLEGVKALTSVLHSCFVNKTDFYLKSNEVKQILASSNIHGTFKEDAFVKVLDDAVENYLNDGIIDNEEKKTIARFIQFSEISQLILNRNHALEKMLQAEVLQDILNGNKPCPKITVSGNFPFMLSKNENLIWLFRNVTLHEQKIRKEYVGRSQGMSFRICKGVYYRTGGFKGRPIETSYMQRIGTGSVCLTDKHIYFACSEKSLKIPYSKILNVDTYSNGIGLQKDAATAKPIFLEGINSWFCYNVIANLKD